MAGEEEGKEGEEREEEEGKEGEKKEEEEGKENGQSNVWKVWKVKKFESKVWKDSSLSWGL